MYIGYSSSVIIDENHLSSAHNISNINIFEQKTKQPSSQQCPTTISYNNILQQYPTTMSHNNVPQQLTKTVIFDKLAPISA